MQGFVNIVFTILRLIFYLYKKLWVKFNPALSVLASMANYRDKDDKLMNMPLCLKPALKT